MTIITFSTVANFGDHPLVHLSFSTHSFKTIINLIFYDIQIKLKIHFLIKAAAISMVGFIYTFWHSVSSTSSILEQGF